MDPQQQQHQQSSLQPSSQPQPQFPMSAPPPPALQSQPPPAAEDSPQIQFAQGDNPIPNVLPVPVSNHPPYAQMITEAITALKDKNGSSKVAIAKYIERVYSNSKLPATHSALLTHHLKRMKEQGSLVMVKHSYKLARSPPVGSPLANANGPKRTPGRPPKSKPAVPPPVVAGVEPGTVPVPVSVPVSGPVSNPESVFASLGLVDAPFPVPMSVSAAVPEPVVKKKPGRPRKVDAGGVGLQPTATLGKKAAGRPRKVAAKNAAPPGTGVVIPVGQPKLKADGTPAKPRGRPAKKNVQNQGEIPAPMDVAPARGPTLVPNVYVGEGVLVAGPAPAEKRRGRRPRAQNGQKTPRKLSGKPLGRPKKVAPPGAVQSPSMQQLLAFNEMRSKLDFFQSRVKHSVNVLKPALESTTAANALGALRELEELANLELGPPLTVQGQQTPPQS